MLQLAIGACLISFSAVFVKLAHVSPGAAAFYRVLFGALALLLVGAATRRLTRPTPAFLAGALVCGLFFAGDLWSWHSAVHYIGPGQATLLANFQVFFLALVSVMFLKQRLRPVFVAALVPAMAGLYMVVGVGWAGRAGDYKAGVFFGLLAAVLYTGYTLTLKKSVTTGQSPLMTMLCVSLTTTVITGSAMAVSGDSAAVPDTASLAVLVAYGVLSQGLGWLLISQGLAKTPASMAGLILLLQPTLAYVWDVLFFNKPVTGIEACGALLALAAIYLGSTKGNRPTSKE